MSDVIVGLFMLSMMSIGIVAQVIETEPERWEESKWGKE